MLLSVRGDGPERIHKIGMIVGFLQRWNLSIMKEAADAGRPYPRLTLDVAIYMPDPPETEMFQPCDVLLVSHRANCKSLAAYEAAWLQLNGFPKARAVVEKSNVGFHVVAYTKPGGRRICPSTRLGMR